MERTLDIRGLEPKHRHAKIHEAFDELKPGDTLLLINDHNPTPLYYELKATHPDFDVEAYRLKEEEADKWVAELKKKAK